MREIKFKAWHKREKFMHTVAELHWCQGELKFYGPGVGEGSFGEFELMQYTGLKDKNGKEIYEGDVVDCGLGVRKVKYNHKQAAFKYYSLKFNLSFEMLESQIRATDKIIGNIYENPELLKESNERKES